MSKWNVSDVNAIIRDVERATGEKLGLEVKVNGRLKKALARCFTQVRNGKHIPTKLEFGKAILEVEEYEIFRQVALHEIGHAIANKRYQDNCNHDWRFKEVCKTIGCYNTGAYCSKEYSLALEKAYSKLQQGKTKTKTTSKPKAKQEITKYHVVCKECGHIYHYSKKCDKTTNPHHYRCACGGDVHTIQNW